MRRLLTFIMAGGKGERLYPLTKDRAKPAVPFGGIYRIIDFTLSNCINSGIRRIHVLTQYKSHSLDLHLKMGWNIFNAELKEYIDVIPAQQRVGESWYRGTADAIYQNIYTIEAEKPDQVLILAGDHIYKMDYSKLINEHRLREADVTVGLVKMPKAQSPNLGVVQVDSGMKMIGFQEKPKNPITIPGEPNLIYASMGIYVFNRMILEEELVKDAKRTNSAHDFGRDVIPSILDHCKVFGYDFGSNSGETIPYWRDIGTIDAYWEANMDLIQITPVFNLYDKQWPIRTYQEQYPPAKTVFDIEEEGRVGLGLDSLISNGCIISGGRVERSVLSPGVRVNSYSSVSDSVLMEGVSVGRYAKIKRAIIDKDVQIPPNVEIGYDLDQDRKSFHVTESEIVVVPKGTIISSGNMKEVTSQEKERGKKRGA